MYSFVAVTAVESTNPGGVRPQAGLTGIVGCSATPPPGGPYVHVTDVPIRLTGVSAIR